MTLKPRNRKLRLWPLLLGISLQSCSVFGSTSKTSKACPERLPPPACVVDWYAKTPTNLCIDDWFDKIDRENGK